MSVSTRNTPSSMPDAACTPFSGLGHAMESVEAVARCLCPRWEEACVSARPRPGFAKGYGYTLQCRLGRETRAG